MPSKDEIFMSEALAEAKMSLNEGGIPIGAVLVRDGEVIGRGHNHRIQRSSAIFHAEIDCLENAGRLRADDYKRCVLYSTLSPCDMCSGAILLFGIPRVVIGENSTFKGPEKYLEERGVEVVNLSSVECRKLMADFIEGNPDVWYEDIGK